VIAGRPGADARTSLDAIARPPLRGHVEYRGYVPQEERQRMYAGARVLVLPSLEEGFGMPALEAMSLGIPVVVSDRGALPALVGDAGLLVDPEDVESIAAALDRVLGDDSTAQTMSRRGLARSSGFQWTNTAAALRDAFQLAIDARRLSPP
jgi:glycosyltransferase involved in cell wall biosynthesis